MSGLGALQLPPLHIDTKGRSADLCLDLEAVCDYREQSDSPTSITYSENADELATHYNGSAGHSSMLAFRSDAFVDGITSSQYNNHHVVVNVQSKDLKRRQTFFAKHKRMSLIASAVNPRGQVQVRKSLFPRLPKAQTSDEHRLVQRLTLNFAFQSKEVEDLQTKPLASGYCPIGTVFEINDNLETILSFLDERELLQNASLVNSTWADVATDVHAKLMLMSVGNLGYGNDAEYDSDDDATLKSLNSRSKAQLMERSWDYLTSSFPWACFLSEGGFKSVYKVLNNRHRAEEAISVM